MITKNITHFILNDGRALNINSITDKPEEFLNDFLKNNLISARENDTPYIKNIIKKGPESYVQLTRLGTTYIINEQEIFNEYKDLQIKINNLPHNVTTYKSEILADMSEVCGVDTYAKEKVVETYLKNFNDIKDASQMPANLNKEEIEYIIKQEEASLKYSIQNNSALRNELSTEAQMNVFTESDYSNASILETNIIGDPELSRTIPDEELIGHTSLLKTPSDKYIKNNIVRPDMFKEKQSKVNKGILNDTYSY